MKDFEYDISLIIPVYNAGKYLRDCLDSLVMQEFDMNRTEVLLIVDGATDDSLDICREYAACYSWMKVFAKENEGVSATRNLGIRKAQGKYIMYLDADDMLTEKVISNVYHFFEEHYDETDIVAYPEKTYLKDGSTRPLHVRYKTLNKTGIYDAQKEFHLFQVRLNIAVKNRGEDNLMFDEELGYHEDQKYCGEILRDKLKLGFVDGCEYKYIIHDDSITGENTNALDLFEPTTHYWEQLFASFEEEVPRYYQSLYMHDLSWKMSQNCLLPYYLDGEEFEQATNRLWKLLERVDVDEILVHPSIDNFHRYFFLEKKANSGITPIVQKNEFALISGAKKIFWRDSFELIFNKLRVTGDRLLIQCTLKSQFFNFAEKPEIYAKINGEKLVEVPAFHSLMSYYRCKTITNNFWGFYFEYDLNEVEDLEFVVYSDGVEFHTKYYMMPTSPFVVCDTIVRNNFIMKFEQNHFLVKKASEDECRAVREKNNELILSQYKDAYSLRKISEKLAAKRIWLYYDCKGVDYDNGYLQFVHDVQKNDGVERYYILNNDLEQCRELFTEEQLSRVVMFGSSLHKSLFIRAEKIITAFIEEVNLYPFPAEDKKYFMDIMNPDIVYLQHGILHASLPWKYTPERIEVDKVLASSAFELNNFVNKYQFRKCDVMPFGMPRFEKLQKSAKKINRILFAPSWRMYLIGKCINTVWDLTDDKFVNSKYFKKIQEFLNNEELCKCLEENDIYIDFKIHPIFRPYLKHFTINSDRINIAENMVKDEEYSLFITDFSSYVFNFAYLETPIMYFVPDYMEFRAGLNQYRELDLDFKDGFGPFTTEVEDAVEQTIRFVENNFATEGVYRNRVDEFFLPIENCTEKIYNFLCEKSKG